MGLNKTPNIGLNNWLGNEYPKRQDFANDNVIIDTEIKALKDTVNNLELTATNVTIADVDNKFTSPTVEGALLEAINKADSAFQSASSGKNTLATAIGSPLESTDSFSTMGTKISEQITRGIGIANDMLIML